MLKIKLSNIIKQNKTECQNIRMVKCIQSGVEAM